MHVNVVGAARQVGVVAAGPVVRRRVRKEVHVGGEAGAGDGLGGRVGRLRGLVHAAALAGLELFQALFGFFVPKVEDAVRASSGKSALAGNWLRG